MGKFKNWYFELSKAKQFFVILGILIGGLFTVGVGASSLPTSNPKLKANIDVPKAPVVNQETIELKSPIPFDTETINDGALASGTTKVNQEGVDGVKVNKFLVVYHDGKEVSRTSVGESILSQPIKKIIANGTYQTPPPPAPVSTTRPQQLRSSSCDSNYSGCVPIASDVDCAGGLGNGPAYIAGPVNVIGSDIYGLDGDSDGVGCE